MTLARPTMVSLQMSLLDTELALAPVLHPAVCLQTPLSVHPLAGLPMISSVHGVPILCSALERSGWVSVRNGQPSAGSRQSAGMGLHRRYFHSIGQQRKPVCCVPPQILTNKTTEHPCPPWSLYFSEREGRVTSTCLIAALDKNMEKTPAVHRMRTAE